MCAAATKAQKSDDPNTKEHEDYRNFIFLFAITIFHEHGHVFIAFLSLGEQPTPNELAPNLSGIHERTEGEAGNRLEGLIFGHSVVHGRHDHYDDSQVSLYMHFSMEDFEGKLINDLVRRASPSQRD